MSNEEIIREELELIFNDAEKLYIASGKKVSGNWSKGKEINTRENYGELRSYAYLAGRGATKKGNSGGETLLVRIEKWLRARGIKPLEQKMSISTLAFLITRKIHREGTNKENHRQVFEEVITPDRIQKILDRVSSFNVEMFIGQLMIEFNKITKNV